MEEKETKNLRRTKRNVVKYIFISIFLISTIFLIYNLYTQYKEKQTHQNILNDVKIDVKDFEVGKPIKILQLEKLKKQNADIIGLLEIEGTNINYPVCQTNNHSFYLDHDYKREKSSTGALFLDKDFDLNKPSTNYLIYGHRNKQGLMFEDLLKYKNEKFYKGHPTIKFTTEKEDAIYEIIAVFYSRVYYQSEKNVFRYYYFIDAKNEKEFNDYVNNCKKTSIYNIDKSASYGDQLLTLSTCEYSQEDGRFVVVARKLQKE